MKQNSKPQSNPHPKVIPLIREAYAQMTSNPQLCIETSRRALAIAKRYKDPIGTGHALMHIGLGYLHKGELDSALAYFQQAKQVFLDTRHIFGLRSVYNNIGVVYHQWNDRDKALEYYEKTLSMEEALPEPRLRITILNNLGNIHFWALDYESAHNCFLRALEEADKIDFPYGKSLSLASMGDLLIKQERVEEGLIFLNQAIELRKKTNNIHGLIHDLRSIAGAYMGKNDLAEAQNCLEQARRLAKENNYKRQLASILLSYAELYKRRNDQENQVALLEECLGYATAENYRDIAANALRELAQAYEERDELKKALKTYWQYQEIKNYLIDESKNLSIHQLRMQMEVAEREREMALICKTNRALEKKNRQINRQQSKLEIADKKLRYWNSELEKRVQEEVAKQQQQQQLLIQKSKLESLGQLAAGIAHEINQPLGMISLGIQNLLDQLENVILDKGYVEKKESYFNENLNRIRRIIEHVRLFSRDQQDDAAIKTDLIEIVQNALSMISLQCKNQNILLDFEHPHRAVYILANKYRVEQVVLNLLSNARDAIEERFDRFNDQKRIAICIETNSGKIALRISDNGVGIAEELKQQIFDPFFSTKSENKGTGLGLSICYGIVNDLGGNIACESALETGTTMTVEFPDLFFGDGA